MKLNAERVLNVIESLGYLADLEGQWVSWVYDVENIYGPLGVIDPIEIQCAFFDGGLARFSPAGIQRYLGCSLEWALSYHAMLDLFRIVPRELFEDGPALLNSVEWRDVTAEAKRLRDQLVRELTDDGGLLYFKTYS